MSLNHASNSTAVESWYVVVNTASPSSLSFIHHSIATRYPEAANYWCTTSAEVVLVFILSVSLFILIYFVLVNS